MKFRCERDSLVEALTTAGRAVSARATPSAALNGVRIEADGNRLLVAGTDLDLTVHVVDRGHRPGRRGVRGPLAAACPTSSAPSSPGR